MASETMPSAEQTEGMKRGEDRVGIPSIHRVMTGSHLFHEHNNAACERAGVTLGIARALEYLAETQGTRTPTVLARTLERRPASVSPLISRMLENGYITAVTDPDDRRSVILGLTDKGQAKWAEVRDPLKQAENAIAARFGPSRIDQLADEFQTIAADLKAN